MSERLDPEQRHAVERFTKDVAELLRLGVVDRVQTPGQNRGGFMFVLYVGNELGDDVLMRFVSDVSK